MDKIQSWKKSGTLELEEYELDTFQKNYPKPHLRARLTVITGSSNILILVE